jgi:hypothetical protein
VASATGRSLQTSCATLGLLISTKRGGGTPWALLVSANRTGPAGGDGKADAGGDPLHAMQFRPPPPPQVRGARPAHRPPRSNRDCPLDTARARSLRHAGGTTGESITGDLVTEGW